MKQHSHDREGPEGRENTSGGDSTTSHSSHAANATAVKAPAGRTIITERQNATDKRVGLQAVRLSTKPSGDPRAEALRAVRRTFPLNGSYEVYELECFVTPNPFWEFPMVVKGWLTAKEAAARWGVTEKTLYSVIEELEGLGIRLPGAHIKLDTELFHTLWLYGAPERRSRAQLLAERDQRRLAEGVEQLPRGRRKKSAAQEILDSLGKGTKRARRKTFTEVKIDREVARGGDRQRLLEKYADAIAEDRRSGNYVE